MPSVCCRAVGSSLQPHFSGWQTALSRRLPLAVERFEIRFRNIYSPRTVSVIASDSRSGTDRIVRMFSVTSSPTTPSPRVSHPAPKSRFHILKRLSARRICIRRYIHSLSTVLRTRASKSISSYIAERIAEAQLRVFRDGLSRKRPALSRRPAWTGSHPLRIVDMLLPAQ
jgi:hypothetical protein